MFSRAPVIHGTRIVNESELLGDVAGTDVIIVDGKRRIEYVLCVVMWKR